MMQGSDSLMPIDKLDPVIVHNVVNDLGWRDLRPVQYGALDVLAAGDDALVLAPTAGGKTEAAMFPLLSRMAREHWTGLSVLYVCPLRALINNLLPRMERYTGWIGRRAALWHGDVPQAARGKIATDPPDVLITTPESLESMLVSVNVDHRRLFADLRAVVVDEVHAFAADDRGWHMRAVLERLTRLVGRPMQRIGLSATVGNPAELARWLQGSSADVRTVRVVDSATQQVAFSTIDIELDYVGSIENAARLISALHAGEKRLVFCEARHTVEELGRLLRARGITTFLSHSSLSRDERRRSEQAFAESRDCVIVSTSTLELGVDVGDLDRVIQVDAPATVASLLQRCGRSGRRDDRSRNCLLLATRPDALLEAAGLLVLWERGRVEAVVPPPAPRHIAAQQLLALVLQEGQVGDESWAPWWNGLEPFDRSSRSILQNLLQGGFLETDGGMMLIGQKAERRFGRRHFMELTTSFTAAPEFTVLVGRTEVGSVDRSMLVDDVTGPRLILLAGESWKVRSIDWKRSRCFVEPAAGGGRARWPTSQVMGLSFELVRAMRQVVLGTSPSVRLTRRAADRLASLRAEHDGMVRDAGTVVVRDRATDVRWWTWAGHHANATLTATLKGVALRESRIDDRYVALRGDLTRQMWRDAIAGAPDSLRRPEVDERAVAGLKFSDALPRALATSTLAARLADFVGATTALTEPVSFVQRG